jgi:hypothetical protein
MRLRDGQRLHRKTYREKENLKMKVRRWIFHIGFALLITQPLLLVAGPASGRQCSTKTTEGRYMVICDGYLSPAPNAPMVPAKLVGTAVSDESGTFRSTDSRLSLGGTPLHQTVIGTEVLAPDCTGTITYEQTIDGQPAGTINLAFVVSENGHRIDGLSIDAGAVFSCHLTRISREEW